MLTYSVPTCMAQMYIVSHKLWGLGAQSRGYKTSNQICMDISPYRKQLNTCENNLSE